LKEGSIIPIRSDLSIGRKDGNSIVMADQHVSGNHAQILVRNNGLFLEDLQSTKGDYLCIKKIKGISAPEFPFLLHTPGDNMLFCQPTTDGG
ncbi:FHA-domain containing secreted protein, partial [human gut metagenome]